MVSRENIYEDVLHLYTDRTSRGDIFCERPFRVQFRDEKALDVGGVTRDMFSAFYEKVYGELFDGPSLLVPIDFPIFSTSPLPILGTIISHAYLIAGILPVDISFPSLCAMLRCPNSIPEDVLIQSFVDSLNYHEAGIVNSALSVVKSTESISSFPDGIKSSLINVYSRYGVREIPKPGNFKELIIEIAKFYFLRKPAAAISEIKSGIPDIHIQFWNNMSIGDLYSIYKALQASPSKVLSMLEDITGDNQSQERVFCYLQQYYWRHER